MLFYLEIPGYLTFKINNTSITKTIGRDVVKVLFDNLNSGTYTVFVTYSGDNNYKTSEEYNFTLENLRLTPELSLNFTNITYGELFNVNAISGSVTFRLNGLDMTVDLSNNQAEAIFESLGLGNYTIYATFNGDNNYNPHEENINISVVKADPNLDISAENVDWGNDVLVIVKTDSRFSGNVSVKLGHIEKIVEIIEGSGNVSFTNLNASTYNVVAKFNETELFNSSQKTLM